METLVHYILKSLWVIRIYSDKKGNKTWIFNFYNPFGWALLIAWAIILGCIEGVSMVVRTIHETIKDSKNP